MPYWDHTEVWSNLLHTSFRFKFTINSLLDSPLEKFPIAKYSALSDSELPTETEGGGLFDAVEAAESLDSGVVLTG